jgi:hypothetical protein
MKGRNGLKGRSRAGAKRGESLAGVFFGKTVFEAVTAVATGAVDASR